MISTCTDDAAVKDDSVPETAEAGPKKFAGPPDEFAAASPSGDVEGLKRQLMSMKRELREEWIRFEEQMRLEQAAHGSKRQVWLIAGIVAVVAILGAMDVYRFFATEAIISPVAESERAFQAAEEHIVAGRRLTAEKNYRDAAAAFTQAIACAPHDARAYMGRGFAWFQLEEYGPAATDFDTATKEMPDLCDAYTWRGNAHQRQHQYDQAIRDFGEVIRLAPTADVGYFNRGLAWLERKDYMAALSDLNKAVNLRPSESWNYATRSKVYRAIGKTEEARSDLDTAVRLNPRNAEALFLRAMIHFESNQTEPGLTDFAEAMRANPEGVAQFARTYRRGDSATRGSH